MAMATLKLLLLSVLGLSVHHVDSWTSLRDYCDDYVFQSHGQPTFPRSPQRYIMNYYKRCIHHDMWVDCILNTRRKPPKEVQIQGFEKGFPPEKGMRAAGIVFCQMKLSTIKPDRTDCFFNTTMCNRVYESGDKCLDSFKKVVCIWGQLTKCDYYNILPVKNYELGLLGGKCLKERSLVVYPNTRASEDCDKNGSRPAPALRGPSVVDLILLVVMTSDWLAAQTAAGSILA